MELANFETNESWVIDHQNAGFTKKKQGIFKPEMVIIPLGLLEKRICWDSIDNKFVPLCKSPDNRIGYPTGVANDALFDLVKHKIPLNNYNYYKLLKTGTLKTIACEECPLSEWSNSTQMCQKKLYIPFISNEFSNNYELLELSRSGIAEVNRHFKWLKLEGHSPYDISIVVKAERVARGNNKYSVPKIKIHSTQVNHNNTDKLIELFAKARSELVTDALPRQGGSASLKPMQMGT